MFAKATRNFLKEVDANGNLISVSNLNDSDKLHLLSLVTKKKRYWCWQRPKYQFLSVTLGDVLTEDQSLSPVVVESDFVKYEGKFENHVSGTIETVLGKVRLNIGGKGLVESQSSFGTLRKQEVDLQQLVRDSAERIINLKNPVLQQVLGRRNEVLCVLIQKIVTTQKCVLSEHVQIEEKCGGMVGIQTKTVQVSAMEDGNVIKDTNVVLEIPAATTIAYGIIELYVKLDGQFGEELVLSPRNLLQLLGDTNKQMSSASSKHGGFEHERRVDSLYLDPMAFREFAFVDMPDGGHGTSSQDGPLSVLKQGFIAKTSNALSALQNALLEALYPHGMSHMVPEEEGQFSGASLLLERNFRPFVELPKQQQTALHSLLLAVLFDEELLTVLEQVCDDMAGGVCSLQAAQAMGELKPPQQQDLTAFLCLVGCRIQGECPGPEDKVTNQKLFATAYFLVSALAEMPDNAASLLGTCCNLQIIPALCHLFHSLSDGGVSDLEDPILAPLKDTERFGIVQRLFASTNINLERLQSSVKAVVLKEPHVFPLILCITLNGLCALGRGHE